MCTSVLFPLTKGLIHFTPGRLMQLFRTQMAMFRTRCCLDAPVTLLECQRSGTYHQALVFVCRPLPKAPLFKVWPVDLHTDVPDLRGSPGQTHQPARCRQHLLDLGPLQVSPRISLTTYGFQDQRGGIVIYPQNLSTGSRTERM